MKRVLLFVILLLSWPSAGLTGGLSRPPPLVPFASGWVDGHKYMKCDSVTDDTAGFQSAVNAAYLGTLFLPSGQCQISATIAVTDSIHIIGAGGSNSSAHSGTVLKWSGASSSTPMLDLQGIRDSVFENFLIVAQGNPLAIGIRS